MENQRLMPEQTSLIVDGDVRSFLEDRGIPVGGALVELDSGAGDAVEIDGAEMVRVGKDRSTGGFYVVSGADGRIYHVDLEHSEMIYVNCSPSAFASSLNEFENAVQSDEVTGGDLDDAEIAAERFRKRLIEVDPTAMQDETGFWGTLVFDLASGDYS